MREIRSPLDGILSPFAAKPPVPFVPSSLFASGEDGAWYDPSDTTSLYQSRTGGDYADTDGDVVGIMLDKSQMGSSTAADFIAAQPEVITEGDFSNGGAAWDLGSNWTVTGGEAVHTPGAAGYITQFGVLTAGKYYKVTFDITFITGGAVQFIGAFWTSSVTFTTVGTHTVVLKAAVADFRLYGNVIFDGSVDNITVKEIPGNHAVAPNDDARPLYKTAGGLHWLEFDGVDDYWEASVSGLGATSASATAFEAVDTVGVIHAGDTSGKYYDIYQDGSTSTSLRSGAGSPTSRVNGAAYSGTTRDDLHTAVAGGSPVILTYESLDLLSWTKFGFGNYEQYSVGRSVEGDMYGCVLLDRALTTDERSDLEAYLAAKSGVTL